MLRGTVDEHRGALPPIGAIELGEGYLEQVLGCPVDASEAATALARLGFSVEQDGGTLTVTPPHFRRDVRIPVDVVEEVDARSATGGCRAPPRTAASGRRARAPPAGR